VEIVGSSISSINVADALGRNLTPLARQVIPLVNPHIRYLDLKSHVYTKVTVTPEYLDVCYIAVQTVLEPVSVAFLLQRFRVRDGELLLSSR
jgi:hypothetical protein